MVYVNRPNGILFLHPSKTCGTTIKNTLQGIYDNENKLDLAEMIRNLWTGDVLQSMYYHLDAEGVVKKFPDANDTCHTIIAVRNPYDRMYSLYAYVVDKVNVFGARFFWFLATVVIILIFITFMLPFSLAILIWLIVIFFVIFLTYKGNGMSLVVYSLVPFNESMTHVADLMESHKSIFGTQSNHCSGLRVDSVIHEDEFEEQFNTVLRKLNIDTSIKTSNTGASGTGKIKQGVEMDGVAYRYIDKYTPESIAIVNKLYADDFSRFGLPMIDPETMTHLTPIPLRAVS